MYDENLRWSGEFEKLLSEEGKEKNEEKRKEEKKMLKDRWGVAGFLMNPIFLDGLAGAKKKSEFFYRDRKKRVKN